MSKAREPEAGPAVLRAPGALRWIASPTARIPRTKHGLLDTEMCSHSWYDGDRPAKADLLIRTPSSYVLLAPGGAGKTTLIDELKSLEPGSVTLDLRMHSRDALPSVVESLMAGAQSVFVDALDEALPVDPNVGYVLTRLLDQEDSKRVPWRFACRPASWTSDLAAGIRGALPDLDEWELLPLDLHGVRRMAGADADEFLEAVAREHLLRQVALPLAAQQMLRHWQDFGALPASRSDAMAHTVARLLQEHGAFRSPQRQSQQRLTFVAQRLAAVTMLCGVSRFALGPLAEPGISTGWGTASRGAGASADGRGTALSVTAVPLDADPDMPGGPLTVDDLREVLGTSLFSPAGEGSVAFIHQSYAEFLTAEFLARRRVTGTPLTSLLGADVNGLTPGPMVEVLGWMLALEGDVPRPVLGMNAKALLSTAGMELARADVRAHVTDALLQGAAAGTVDEGWGLDTSILAHPGLAARLHDAAQAASNMWEVFWIARLARHCVVSAAADDLLAIAVSPAWPHAMRAEAVRSFAAVAPVDRMPELDDLLTLDEQEDPDDEILAAALRARLATLPGVERLVEVLRPQRRPSYIGDYAMLLDELPALTSDADALPLLRHITVRPDSDAAGSRRLAERLLRKIWNTAHLQTLRALGQLVAEEGPSRQVRRAIKAVPWAAGQHPERRRAIAAGALTAGERSWYAVLSFRLLTGEDLPWLIEWVASAPPEAVAPAGQVLQHLAQHVADATSADQVLSLDPTHPAYDALSGFRGAVAVADRPAWLDAHDDDDEPAVDLEPSLVALRRTITDAHADVETWWACIVALSGDDWPARDLFLWDFTSRPLWTHLEADEQEDFWQLALEYVTSRQPGSDPWEGRGAFTLQDVMPDCAALFAFATAAAHRPTVLTSLPQPVWETWAPAIVAAPAITGAADWQPPLHRAAPPAAQAALSAAVRDALRSGQAAMAQQPLADFSDPGLLRIVAEIAGDRAQPPHRRTEGFEVLVEHARDTAVQVARTVMAEQDPPAGASHSLALLAPQDLVAMASTTSDVISLAEPLYNIDLERLPDEPLANLARLLLDALPFADDPARSAGFVEVTPQSRARRLRANVLQTLAARGLTASLEQLAGGRPDPDVQQIRHLLLQARAHEAMRAWQPTEPSLMMALVASGDARLVRDGAGLLAVLQEHLGRVQHDLQERALFRSLWNGEPGQPGASPKIEDDISDWLRHELALRLSPHVLVDREIQVTRSKPNGIGTRMDITVTSHGTAIARMACEAKHVQNQSLMTALDGQLVGQYMRPMQIEHGLYLVYWVHPDDRPSSWSAKHPDPAALAAELRQQADRRRPGRQISVTVLDVGPPRTGR